MDIEDESPLRLTYYTSLVALTVACAWRSFLITPEWPLKDAIISAVSPSCEEVCREASLITVHGDKSHIENSKSCVVTKQQLVYFDWRISILCTKTEHTLFECSCAAVHEVDQNNVSWVVIVVCENNYTPNCISRKGYCAWLLLGALNILSCFKLHTIKFCSSGSDVR